MILLHFDNIIFYKKKSGILLLLLFTDHIHKVEHFLKLLKKGIGLIFKQESHYS